MKKAFVRYGAYAGGLAIVFHTINLLVLPGLESDFADYAGYAGIILSLSLLYFGIRYYRDRQNNGILTFGQGLKTGMLITLVPALCFALADVFYIVVVDPQFYQKYGARHLLKLKATLPAAEYQVQAAEFQAQMDFFSKPINDFLLMFCIVLALGLIFTVISTFILKRSTPKANPAYAGAG